MIYNINKSGAMEAQSCGETFPVEKGFYQKEDIISKKHEDALGSEQLILSI